MTVGLKDLILNQVKAWSQAVLVYTHAVPLHPGDIYYILKSACLLNCAVLLKCRQDNIFSFSLSVLLTPNCTEYKQQCIILNTVEVEEFVKQYFTSYPETIDTK